MNLIYLYRYNLTILYIYTYIYIYLLIIYILSAIEVVFLSILRQVELHIERPGQKLKVWQTVAEWDVAIGGKLVR